MEYGTGFSKLPVQIMIRFAVISKVDQALQEGELDGYCMA